MRPKTSSSGIFRTKRNRPVSVRTLTRMLVPKPKKAFQSPGTHRRGLAVVMVVFPAVVVARADSAERRENFLRMRDPAEDAVLGLDPGEGRGMEIRGIRGHAVPGGR